MSGLDQLVDEVGHVVFALLDAGKVTAAAQVVEAYAERARQAWRADLHPEVLVGIVIDPATNPLNLGRKIQPMIHN